MKTHLTTSLAVLAAGACALSTAGAALIASESFWTTGTEADAQYLSGPPARFNTLGNTNVVVGNSGFGGPGWGGATGTIFPTNGAPDAGGLTHSLVAGTVNPGATDFRVSHTRSMSRALASTASLSANYYLSGIVRANQNFVNNTNYFSMGMADAHPGNNSSSITTGIHLGMYRNGSGELRLAAYGGGTTYDLGAAALDTNYLLVVGLTADSAGDDTLDAWMAPDGGSLSQVVTGQTLETFGGAADVSRLVVQQNNGSGDDQVTRAWGDEMRFGTTFNDVVIPEPSAAALLGLVAGLGLLRRRRK